MSAQSQGREPQRVGRGREVTRSSLYVPLVVWAILFTLLVFLEIEPVRIPQFGGDVRYIVFGKDLRWLRFAVWVPAILFIVRLLDAFAFGVVTRRRNVAVPALLREIVSIALYGFLFAYAVSRIFNYSIAALLTTGTVLAAVVGLALQDTLGNLFSGIALHMEGSFEVGDVLHSGDYIGVVEGVNWRATTIRAFSNQIVLLPNSAIARERLEVFPRNNLNGRALPIAVDWHVPPGAVIPILTQAMAHVDGVARELPCFTRVASFGESAVVYELKYFTRDYAQRDRIDAEIKRAVWYALRRNDISIPFPVRAFQQYTPPKSEQAVMPDELLARLQAVELLSPLDDEGHETLAAAAQVHVYSKGETILSHGAIGQSMFVVHAGTVSIRVAEGPHSGWQEVAQLGPGSVFGEMALLTGEARSADVVALTDVTAIEILKSSLQPILQDHPELAAAISAKVAERRDVLTSTQPGSKEEQERSILSRIREYFGL